MNSNSLHRIYTLLLVAFCGVGLHLSGCSLPSWGRSTAKNTTSLPGVLAPHERIATLREQRKRAGSLSPQAANQLAAELASQCAEEEDPLIRTELVLTLGALPSNQARQALLAAAQDPSSKVREAVCKSWGSIGDETASGELARILSSDMDPDVRHAAARALGKAGGTHALAALGSALDDRDPALQYLAMESLKKTSGQNYGHDVRLWKQYVESQVPTRDETSVAQRGSGVPY